MTGPSSESPRPSPATTEASAGPQPNPRPTAPTRRTEDEGGETSPSLAASVTERDLWGLKDKFPFERIQRGTVLIRQSDPPNRFFIVLSGGFVVLRPDTRETISEIGPGEPVGELAFFAQTERTGDIMAVRDSEVIAVNAEDYGRLVREAPQIFSDMFVAVTKRFARVVGVSPAVRPSPPRTIALLPIGVETRLPDSLVSKLADAIAPCVAASLSSDSNGLSGDTDANGLRERLMQAETTADVVLFALERKDTPFSRACLGIADHLLLIAPSSDIDTHAVTPTEIEREAADKFVFTHRTLIVWRENTAVPITGTGRWLEERDVKLHHHLALNSRDDFERLGRFLTGSALGLVLGGGGALGCAHLGIAKALQQAGESIDFICGTSAGAAMGAAIANGFTAEETLDLIEEMNVRSRATRRWTIPVHSLFDHRVYDEWLRRIFSARTIEDMPYNYFAVSSNLSDNSGLIHRRGPVWEAIRASTAVPGLFAPFITPTGEVLVDGAMIDNVPIGTMHDLKLGPNVVVKLSRPGPWRVSSPYADFPTPGSLLRNLLFRQKRPYYPPLTSILIRAMIVASEQRLHAAPAEDDYFYVLPQEIAGIGFLDWKKGRSIADAAYRHMSNLLETSGSLKALLKANA